MKMKLKLLMVLLTAAALAADAQTFAIKFSPETNAIFAPYLVSQKFWLTPTTNPPAAGAAYTLAVAPGMNICAIPNSLTAGEAPGAALGYWWGATTFTNSTGFHDTPFTTASLCPFTLPLDAVPLPTDTQNPAAPSAMGIIKQ